MQSDSEIANRRDRTKTGELFRGQQLRIWVARRVGFDLLVGHGRQTLPIGRRLVRPMIAGQDDRLAVLIEPDSGSGDIAVAHSG